MFIQPNKTTLQTKSYSVYARDLFIILACGVFLYVFDLPQLTLFLPIPICMLLFTALKHHARYRHANLIWTLATTSIWTSPFLPLYTISPNSWFLTITLIHLATFMGLLYCLLNAAYYDTKPQLTGHLLFRIAKLSYLYGFILPLGFILYHLCNYIQKGYTINTIYDLRLFFGSLSFLPVLILIAPVFTGFCLWASDRLHPIIAQPQQKESPNE